jgi:hypothetical protein
VNPSQLMNAYYLIVALLNTNGATCEVKVSDDWSFRVSLGYSHLMIDMTFRYPHPDGRVHSACRSQTFERKAGTANVLHVWLNQKSNELLRVKEDLDVQFGE